MPALEVHPVAIDARDSEAEKLDAIRTEMERHTFTMKLLTNPSFWERHQQGLAQIARGETVTLDELEEVHRRLSAK